MIQIDTAALAAQGHTVQIITVVGTPSQQLQTQQHVASQQSRLEEVQHSIASQDHETSSEASEPPLNRDDLRLKLNKSLKDFDASARSWSGVASGNGVAGRMQLPLCRQRPKSEHFFNCCGKFNRGRLSIPCPNLACELPIGSRAFIASPDT